MALICFQTKKNATATINEINNIMITLIAFFLLHYVTPFCLSIQYERINLFNKEFLPDCNKFFILNIIIEIELHTRCF